MKKATLAILLLFLLGCSGSDDDFRNNPNIPSIRFNLLMNLNLPEYSNLQYAGNSYVTYLYGVKGVVVYNINGSQFAAFELSDPNHPPNECSSMQVDGIIATCSCDGNEYNIITGEMSNGDGEYTMRPYRVNLSGNTLEVWN